MATILDQCKEKIEKATPGPWQTSWFGTEENCSGMGKLIGIAPTFGCDFEKKTEAEAFQDIEFIAFSRTVMPILVERLEKAIQAIRKLESDGAPMFADELEAPIDVRKE